MKRFFFLPIFLCLIACQSQEQQIKKLVDQLGDRAAVRRTEAIEALVKIGPDAVDALIHGLSDENPQIREMSAWTLSEIKTPAARIVPALITVLTDPDENIRVVGSVALQNVGEPAVPYLIEALASETAEIRLNAAYALGEIGTPLDTILPALIGITHRSGMERSSSCGASLGYNRSMPAVDSLVVALNSPNADLRRMAERALNDIGTPQARKAIADAKKGLADR